jgi:hypothetical protein
MAGSMKETARQTERKGEAPAKDNGVVEEEQLRPEAQVDKVPRPAVLPGQAGIAPGACKTIRPVLGKGKADPSSEACAILEILCVTEFVDSQIMKTRESDALEAYRGRNEGKKMALKTARLERQNQLDEARAAKLRLENQALENKIALVREETLQAHEAKKLGKPFNYERALNQISAVIGLRGPEMFRHEKRPRDPS